MTVAELTLNDNDNLGFEWALVNKLGGGTVQRAGTAFNVLTNPTTGGQIGNATTTPGLPLSSQGFNYTILNNIGDVRVWRGRSRENFDAHTLELLRLIEPAFTGALLRAQDGSAAQAADASALLLRLSVREYEISRMIADDRSDKEIAWRIGVEISTVRTHLKRIFDKLGVRSRSGVASLLSRHR